MGTVSIKEFEASNKGSVWVINKSSGKDKGDITFTVPKISGNGSDSVIIPLTFLPIDLTEHVSKKQLMDSSEFRRALRLGMLNMISDDDADALLSIPGADQEKARLRNEALRIDTIIQSSAMGIVDGSTTEEDDNSIDGVPPSVVTLLEDTEGKDEVSIINTLRTMTDELTIKHYDYISSKADGLRFKKLAAFCSNRIKELNGITA